MHFDARDTDFIPQWIESLFKHIDQMSDAKYESLSKMVYNKSASDDALNTLH